MSNDDQIRSSVTAVEGVDGDVEEPGLDQKPITSHSGTEAIRIKVHRPV